MYSELVTHTCLRRTSGLFLPNWEAGKPVEMPLLFLAVIGAVNCRSVFGWYKYVCTLYVLRTYQYCTGLPLSCGSPLQIVNHLFAATKRGKKGAAITATKSTQPGNGDGDDGDAAMDKPGS